MSIQGLRFTLEVGGLDADTFAVVSFRLNQHLSSPFVLEVDVASSAFRLTAEELLEKNATLTVWQGEVPQRTVTGVVTAFGMKENNNWQMQYRFTIHPPLWRTGLSQNFRIFQQQDIQAISALLLNENGVTDWKPYFYEDHPAREFCVQYGESDLAFLSPCGPKKAFSSSTRWRRAIRLPGQQYDQETGLYYNRHRYYDPQQGRI